MNKRQKLVQKQFLNNEEAVIKRLKSVYNQSLKDINDKSKQFQAQINELQALIDVEEDEGTKATLKSMQQSKIYQKQYQDALKKQINGILDTMQVEEFKTVDEYLKKCYEDGFIGTMYDLQGQGIPMCMPLDQEAMVRAVQTDSKISQGLYQRLGEDVDLLKRKITAQVSRGIATGMTWQQVAQQLSNYTNIGYNNAVRIARTEGHRIQVQSTMDACYKAKDIGADVVKQWDSALDKRTRESHAKVDGEIRELDKPFSNGLMFPGDPHGGAAEVVNCRCALLQRAKWALDDKELETLKERAAYYGLDKTDNFNDYKKKYLKASETELKKLVKNGIIESDKGMFPDTIAGVKRGKTMTFEEANTGKTNPKYGEAYGYAINCQACVVTFEARQRGYDVQVLPNTKGSMLQQLSRKTNMAWIDSKTGEAPEYIKDDSLKTAKQYLSFVERIVEQGNRYTIEFAWKGRRSSGHIVNLDRNDSGELRIKDNQRGLNEKSEWIGNEEVLQYLSRMKYQQTFYGTKYPCVPKILRIDDLQFNKDVVDKIMERVK